MVTLRWHSSPAPAHMATRFSARSEGGGGGWVGREMCFLGVIQREPSQPALEHGGPLMQGQGPR